MSLFDRLDVGLFEWILSTYIPLYYHIFCKRVCKRWYRGIANIRRRAGCLDVGTFTDSRGMNARIIVYKRIELLEELWRGLLLPSNTWRYAVRCGAGTGDVKLLKWIYTHPHKSDNTRKRETRNLGDLSTIDTHHVFENIGASGNIECFEWAHDQVVDTIGGCFSAATRGALKHSQINFLDYLRRTYPSTIPFSRCYVALENGHWGCYKWCHDHHVVRIDRNESMHAVYTAVRYGDPEIVNKLLKLEMYEKIDTKRYFQHPCGKPACESESIEMIRYVQAQGCPITFEMLVTAIKKHNTPACLLYLFEESGRHIDAKCVVKSLSRPIDIVKCVYVMAPHMFTRDLVAQCRLISPPVKMWLREKNLL